MSKVKTYTEKSVAEAVASKLSKDDKKFVVHEVTGGFQVLPEGQEPQPTVTDISGQGTVVAETTKATKAAKKEDPKANEQVTFVAKGAHETAQYVITPVLGKRPRWFEKKRIVASETVEGGVKITCTRRTLTSRGISPEDVGAVAA